MDCTVCGKKLRRHNKIGTCRVHRSLSPVRKAYEKAWQQDHPEQYAAAKNQWTRSNPQYYADYRNNDLTNKIAHSLRVRVRKLVKKGSAVKNLGCTVSEFLAHLEKQFTKGMTWSNYGEWHIDHIIPLSAFDLTQKIQFETACHYSNMQPLWAHDNISKNDSLEY